MMPLGRRIGRLRCYGFHTLSAPQFPRSGPATGPCNGLHPTSNFLAMEAEARCDCRRTEEAKRGVEILERIKVLGQTKK